VDPLEAIADPVARAEFQRLGKRIEDMQSTLADMKGMLSTLLASQNTPSGSGAPSVGGDAWSRHECRGRACNGGVRPLFCPGMGTLAAPWRPPWGDPEECAVLSALCGLLAPHRERHPTGHLPQSGCEGCRRGMPYRNWRVCVMSSIRRSSRHVRGPELVSRVRVQVKMTLTSTKQPMHWCITTCWMLSRMSLSSLIVSSGSWTCPTPRSWLGGNQGVLCALL